MQSAQKDDTAQILKSIAELLEKPDRVPGARFVTGLLRTFVKLVEDRPDPGDLKMLNRAFRELRYAFKVFAPYRDVRKVSVFGSARSPRSSQEYQTAFAFAERMSRLGWMVITGAGPGVMEAAQGGAGRARSFGVNIRLPFESGANEHIANDPKLVHFKYFFTRKVMFLKETDAIVLFPGGFGTHDEGFEALTLVQTGKSHMLPIVFVDREGGTYWEDFRRYLHEHLEARGFIGASDMRLFDVTDKVETAIDIVTRFYSNYHSMRFVRGRMVMRLKREPSDALVGRLNAEFADILADGGIERVAMHPDEMDEPETAPLFRIGLWFNRRSLARLREMVDVLNTDG